MGAKDYTAVERGVLFTLMAEARAVPNVELVDRFSLSLKRPSRDKLRSHGLIEVGSSKDAITRRSRLTLELTEAGWGWASKMMTSALPPRHMGQGPLYAVLNNLSRFMKRQRLIPAEVFGRTNEPDVEQNRGEPPLEEQVRRAYQAIARRPGDWVQLADLRERLPSVPRDSLDAELTRLFSEREVHLVPNENNKAVTARDRAAALRVGSNQHNMIAVR